MYGAVAMTSKRRFGRALGLLGFVGVFAAYGQASAQQSTFKLDRLEVPGAPDDGVAVFRPVTNQRPIFYGQLAVGYSFRPLRTATIATDRNTLLNSKSGAIHNQLTMYGSLGFQFLDRFSLGLTFPFTPIQNGDVPNYDQAGITSQGTAGTTAFTPSGPGAGDMRVDVRAVALRSENRKHALGVGGSLFAPTGTSTNFGGDSQASAMVLVMGEVTAGPIVLTANTGVHFRPDRAMNAPTRGNGLGVGTEWRWALGGFLPIQDGKYRLGLNIFGQTGITDSNITGPTAFTSRNTSIEFNVEGRMRFGHADRWWVGLGAGRGIAMGYGATDLRIVALLGTYVPILDSDAPSPKKRDKSVKVDPSAPDRDHDGIPDEIDACPDEPEDHQGNDPNDGCPMPADRDGDGIPDATDKCPDQPEDKDGFEDGDGCPDDDNDKDGIVDAKDACPKEPGAPNTDPAKNGCPAFIKLEGGQIRVLQQVHFATGKANILPDSFPMLQEIANVLRANPGIQRMSIEGHTDNKGAAAMNKKLSQDRADSVMRWLTEHGIVAGRLEAHGYGMEKPIDNNLTETGRAANRRVEFKILSETKSE